MGVTDASTTAKDVSSIICWSIFLDFLIYYYSHPLFGHLSYQTFLDETLVQEQEFGSSPIGNDPGDVGNNPVVGAQTADLPIRHTLDGKEAIRLFHCDDHELKIFPIIADANARSLEPIQLDVIGASSVVPSPLTETAIEKVLHLLCCPFRDWPSQKLPN